MHVKPSISLLAFALAGLLSQDVLALPFDQPGGMIHLPLKRVEQRRSDVHPQIRHQQYVNRAYRRLARMTGRAEPSDIELRNKLTRRIEFLGRSQPELLSRYNHGTQYDKRQQNINQGGTHNAAVVTPANLPSVDDSLGLSIDGNDESFHAIIQIGTPPRDFRVLVDAGLADLWVGSEKCLVKNGVNCGNHTFLGPQSSTTFVDSGEPWDIRYYTGSVSGTKVNDTISIAGLSLANHMFGVANVETIDFADNSVPYDGILGTAKSGNLTPIEALAKKKLIAGPITSYKTPRLADGKNDGEVTIGGLNPAKFDPATLVTLDNISPYGFWEASLGDVSVAGTSLDPANRTAVFDTGTKIILAPDSDTLAVHKRIPGSKSVGDGSFKIPCNTTVSVALKFGSTVFEIDSRDLAVLPAHLENPNECMSAIVAGDVYDHPQTGWMLGTVFLKNAYFSHDVSTNQIKLAKLVMNLIASKEWGDA